MATGKISKSTVDELMPGKADQFLWDAELRGFGIKMTPKGKLIYLAQYRIGGKKSPTRRVTLGEHGKLTPAEARIEARKVLSKAALKEDVAETRAALRRQCTVGELADRYLAEYVALRNKPSTQIEIRRIVKLRIKPKLGKLKIQGLTRTRVNEWHRGMEETPYEANRALAYLSKMMSLAAGDWDLIPTNPCQGLQRFTEKKRERFLTEHDLASLGESLRACETAGTVTGAFAAALRLLALTGCRLSEVLTLRWEDVGAQGDSFHLADAKTGARSVPLGAAAAKLIKLVPREGDFLFPAVGVDLPMTRHAFHHFWTKVRDASGLTNIRPHDLRHTAGTYAAQAGFNAFSVRDFLGHKSLAMSGRYVERAADPIRATANSVGSRIAKALNGTPGGNIVPLGSAKRRRRK